MSTQVITDANGYFKFNFNDIIFLDKNAKFTFGTKSGAVMQDTVFKTIQGWITASPVTLNLKKLKADFVYDTVQCFGDTLHFVNQSKYGKKPYTYLWNFGHGQTSANENPVKLLDIPGSFNIALKVTDALGCKDSIQKTINIPNPVIAQFVADTAACKDSLINISNTSTGNQITYLWEYGNGLSSTLQAPEIMFADTGMQILKLTVTDVNNCVAAFTQNIKINKCVKPTIFGVLFENQFCGGQPVLNDTVKIIDINQVYTGIYTITNQSGEFYFEPDLISSLDPLALFALQTVTEVEPASLIYKPLSELCSESPLSIYQPKFKKEWISVYEHVPSIQNISTAMDLFDNVYVLGYYAINSSNERMILLKYSPSGELLWSREFIDIPNWRVRSNEMLIDDKGCVYVTAIVDFNGDLSTWDAVYLLKYTPSGVLRWSQYLNYIFEKKEITTLKFDNSYNINIAASLSLRSVNIINTKYDTTGTFLSYKEFNTGGNEYIRDMKTGNDGAIYLTGAVNYGSFFDILTIKYKPSTNSYSYITFNGSADLDDFGDNLVLDSLGNIYVTGRTNTNQPIIIKYNNNLDLQWTYIYNVTMPFSWCYNSIKLVGENLYVGSLTNNSGQNGFSLLKINLQGSLVWARKYDATVYWTKDYYWVLTDNDQNGNIYLSGSAWNGIDHDIFTIKYLPEGTVDWTAITKYPNNEGPTDLYVSPNNNVYFTGITRVGSSFDKIITAKYSQCEASSQALRYSNPESNEQQPNNKQQTTNLKPETLNEYVKM
ncbi:MAG TPA: hypothetical protein DEH02_22205, partial [Bacteroidales bacterium]|nr:hypothetical protein [Bacteroidales bacterium]